jgi:hypothetical protein
VLLAAEKKTYFKTTNKDVTKADFTEGDIIDL